MSVKKLAFSGACTICLGLAILLVVFQVCSQAKLGGHPSRDEMALIRMTDQARERLYIKPIFDAIESDNVSEVRLKWHRYSTSKWFKENLRFRLGIASYYVSKGRKDLAHSLMAEVVVAKDGTLGAVLADPEVRAMWEKTEE